VRFQLISHCNIIVSKLVQAFSRVLFLEKKRERPSENGEDRRHHRKLLSRFIFFLSAEDQVKPSQEASC